MQNRVCLLTDLKNHEISLVVDWAHKEEESFIEEIRSEREWERKYESEQKNI